MLYTFIYSYRKILFTILIVFIFHPNILELLDKYVIPIVSKIPDNSPFIAFCVLSFTLLFIVVYNNYLQKDKFVLSYVLLTELCVTGIYLILKFRFHYVFLGYFIDYVLIFLFPLLIVESTRIIKLIKECLHKRNNEQENLFTFELDTPCADDNLVKERSVYAEHLIQYIFGTFNSYDNSQQSNPFIDNGSFVINVCEEYGYGKTSFFALLYDKLTAQKSNQYIAFCYRPWMCENDNAMVNEFFNIFREELSSYNSHISQNITNYIRTLLDKSDNFFVHFIRTMFYPLTSMKEERQKLKEAIVKIEKPIIVFIDDVDRLQKEELLILLKLVRDTADFQNVFYIMAADKDHLSECLKDCNISNSDKYLKKIINYEFMLPGNDNLVSRFLQNELKSKLSKYIIDEDSQKRENKLNKIVDSIVCHENIESVLCNIRDVKRLLNDYMLTLSIIKTGIEDEIDYKDLFLLTVIKMLRPDVYKVLRENDDQLLNLSNNIYTFKSEYANNVHNETIQKIVKNAAKTMTNKETNIEEEEKCKTIDEMLANSQKSNDEFVAESLRYLFNERRTLDDEIKIKHKESYYRYFSGQLRKEQLSSLEVKDILNLDEDIFQKRIKDIHITNKINSFIARMQEWSKKWEKSQFIFMKKIYLFSKEDLPIEFSKKSYDIGEVEYANEIYYRYRLRYSQILYYLYCEKTNNTIDKDEKKLLHDFIMENDHYVFSAITLNTLSGLSPHNLIIKNEELILWLKELTELFFNNSIKDNPNPFKDEILDIIPILRGSLIDSPWDKKLVNYLNNNSDYITWFERIIIYERENGKFKKNNKYMKQLGFNNYAYLIGIINHCNLEIQQDSNIKDLMDLLRMGEIENDVEKHPFLHYIKSKSINS